MRQGITTKYLGPTNFRGSRIKATARKANPSAGWREMSLTIPYDYSGNSDSRHTKAAKALATKLGWSGLWVGGGKPEEDGNQYVCLGYHVSDVMRCKGNLGTEDQDWFYVPAAR